MMNFLPKTMAALLLVLAAANTANAQSVSLSFGTDVVDLPAITGFGTVVSEMEGTSMKIECSNGKSYQTELNAAGVGIWTDSMGVEVGKIEYDNPNASTFRNRLEFDIFFQNAMCGAPVLTLDLRGACNEATQVVWDIVATPSGTPNSATGALEIEGGGCGTVPVFADSQVGINGASPVGDLYLLLVFDFASCSFSPTAPPLRLVLDSDSTDEGMCATAPPTPTPTLPPIGMDGDPHVKLWSGKSIDYHGQVS